MKTGFVMTLVKTGKLQNFIRSMNSHELVDKVWPVYGDYDVVIQVKSETREQIKDFAKNVKNHEDVSKVSTLLGSSL